MKTSTITIRFATRGLCADLFVHVLLGHELLVGELVLTELKATLRTKPKPAKRTIDEIEADLRDSVVVKTPDEHLDIGISDDDEWIVARPRRSTALTG